MLEVDIDRQPDFITEDMRESYGIRVRNIEAPMKRPTGAGRGQYPKTFVVAEDVGQEDRYFDRCQCVFRHVARRIAATAIETQLSHDAELIKPTVTALQAATRCAPSVHQRHRALPRSVISP